MLKSFKEGSDRNAASNDGHKAAHYPKSNENSRYDLY